MNPVKGWGSISTENGYVIIEPLSAHPEKVMEDTIEVQVVDNVERVQVRLKEAESCLCPVLS